MAACLWFTVVYICTKAHGGKSGGSTRTMLYRHQRMLLVLACAQSMPSPWIWSFTRACIVAVVWSGLSLVQLFISSNHILPAVFWTLCAWKCWLMYQQAFHVQPIPRMNGTAQSQWMRFMCFLRWSPAWSQRSSTDALHLLNTLNLKSRWNVA